MSDITVTLPPPSIPKPLPPPIVTSSIAMRERQKDRLRRIRHKFSPPTLPPPAPPKIIPSPPPYSSISPPPSPPLPASPLHPSAPHNRTPPPRPPPPSIAPLSATPRPPNPVTQIPSSGPPPQPPSHLSEPPSSDRDEVLEASDEAVNTSSEGVEEGGGDCEEVTGDGESDEPHYERAPVSQGGSVLISEGENEDSGPDYVDIDSPDDEEGGQGEGQPSRHSRVRPDYQNWDFIGESDSDDSNHTPCPSQHHHPTQSNPPTLHLNTHPALMKSRSKKKVKRRNRAPPPPPGAKIQGGNKVGGDAGVSQKQEGEREGQTEEQREGEREEQMEEQREGEREGQREGQRGEPEEGREEAEEHDYSTIRRGDYINWEYECEDGSELEDSANGTPKPKTHKHSNPPTLPLNTHPVLIRSHSHGDVIESADDADGKRPKNRAPPPPPAKTKSKPPRGFSRQLSQPHTQLGSDVVKEVGEYARVTKPPLGRRTKSDQPVNLKDKQQQQQQQQQQDKEQQSPKHQEPKQALTPPQGKRSPQHKVPKSGMHPNQYSPLATHKNGAPLGQGGKTPVHVFARASEREVEVRSGEGRTEGGASKLPRAAVGRKKQSTAEQEEEGRVRERDPLQKRKGSSCGGEGQHLTRPKRQAPPPPVGRAVSVEQPEERAGREPPQGAESSPAEKQTADVKAEARLQTPPPKPQRLRRRTPPLLEGSVVIATEAMPTTQESTETEERQTSGSPRSENGQGLDRWERLLHKMEFFTIDLIKEGDRSLGMVIVSGKVRNKDGSTVEGIFMQKILPGSLTDKDGRIQAGDMLVEINGTSMVGGTVDLASKKLRDSRDSVKLKVGRPDRGAFKVPGDDEKEPIYVNSVEDSELQTKLEEAEARATKMEELRHKAEKDLKVIREMADKEQKTFHKKLEEAEEKQEAHKKDAQAKISDLTIALANITVEKTKLEKEVESLKFSQSSHSSGQDGEISSLKRQLKESESERDMAERDLQQLRQEKEANVGFHYRLSELESDRAHTRQERDAIRRQLESTCHELSVAHATLKQMQIEKTALQEENERVSLELERGRKSSTGRMNTEAELVRKKRELSSVLREMQALRDEKERVEKDVVEVRREMEKEKQRNSELQKKLDSQKKEEKTSMGELLSRLQAQAKQIHDLKEELKPQSVSETAVAAGLVAGVREDQREQVGEADETEADKQIGGKPNSVGTAPVEDKPSSSPEITLSKSPEPLLAQSPKRSSPEKSSPGKEGKSPKQHLTAKESISIESFDAVKPTAVLDNTAAKDKTQVALRNAKQHRNRPSREYIRSMSTENLLISPSLEDIANETLPTEKAPVPRPRRPTLEKDSQAHKPSPVPRHLRSPVPPPNDPPQRPPKPSSPQTESERGGQASPDRKKKVATPKPESRGGRMSPPHTRAPSPKPQPTPRRMTKRSDDPPADDAQPKDPSQLSVKERMELAQKAMVKKPPPVIPKKPSSRVHTDDPAIPKSLSQPEAEETELPETRYSYDNELSPRPVKRLPPGAFNIGLLGMTPFGVARQRSNTVATSRDHSQDRDTDDDCREQIQKEAESDVGSSEVLDTDDVEIKLPPKRPPLPTKRTLSNEKPLHLSTRNNDALDEAPPPSAPSDSIDPRMETDGGDSPILQAGPHGTLPDPSGLDYDQVLTWSPTQVASWMNRIGVSQHAKVFLDRGVQGNKLFDMDGAALKAMGVFSQEDRATIKREIRALRPHAEKQKRVLDKQRKDDKKKKKRHFV